MASIDAEALGTAVLTAWKTIAKTHFDAVRDLSRADLEFLQEKAVQLAEGVASGEILPAQAALEAEDMKEALLGMQDVLAVEGKILSQDLANAALEIIGGAVNAAAGVRIF